MIFVEQFIAVDVEGNKYLVNSYNPRQIKLQSRVKVIHDYCIDGDTEYLAVLDESLKKLKIKSSGIIIQDCRTL